jgi:N-acetylmuramoyl-L-alanine amidase
LFQVVRQHKCAKQRKRNRGPALANKVIVIDPAFGETEAEIVYDLAQRLEGRLLALGASVFLTRGPRNVLTESQIISILE